MLSHWSPPPPTPPCKLKVVLIPRAYPFKLNMTYIQIPCNVIQRNHVVLFLDACYDWLFDWLIVLGFTPYRQYSSHVTGAHVMNISLRYISWYHALGQDWLIEWLIAIDRYVCYWNFFSNEKLIEFEILIKQSIKQHYFSWIPVCFKEIFAQILWPQILEKRFLC